MSSFRFFLEPYYQYEAARSSSEKGIKLVNTWQSSTTTLELMKISLNLFKKSTIFCSLHKLKRSQLTFNLLVKYFLLSINKKLINKQTFVKINHINNKYSESFRNRHNLNIISKLVLPYNSRIVQTSNWSSKYLLFITKKKPIIRIPLPTKIIK